MTRIAVLSLRQQITMRQLDLLPLLAPDPWTRPNLLPLESTLERPFPPRGRPTRDWP